MQITPLASTKPFSPLPLSLPAKQTTEPAAWAPQPPAVAKPPLPAVHSGYQFALEMQQSGSTALEVKTQDGDTITLQMQSQWQSALYYSENNTPAAQSKQMTMEQFQGYAIQFQVEGELDEEELAALDQVMQQLSVATNHFFNGDLGGAISSLEQFQLDSEEFTSLAIHMERSVSYSMAESYREVSQLSPGSGQLQPAVTGGLFGLSDYVNNMLQMMDEVNEQIERILLPEQFVTQLMEQAIERDPRSDTMPQNLLSEIGSFLQQVAIQWRLEQPLQPEADAQ
jgi:hypothetical protein